MPSKARRKRDDDFSSSSDSESDCEETTQTGAAEDDCKPLSLLDDDVNDVLILPPSEDAGELESGRM